MRFPPPVDARAPLMDSVCGRAGVDIPEGRRSETEAAASAVGEGLTHNFPFVQGGHPVRTSSVAELQLNRTWRPQLAVVGAAGLPALNDAGPVLRPETTLKLSMRTPPTLDVAIAQTGIKRSLEEQPPYGANVEVRMPWILASGSAPRTSTGAVLLLRKPKQN